MGHTAPHGTRYRPTATNNGPAAITGPSSPGRSGRTLAHDRRPGAQHARHLPRRASQDGPLADNQAHRDQRTRSVDPPNLRRLGRVDAGLTTTPGLSWIRPASICRANLPCGDKCAHSIKVIRAMTFAWLRLGCIRWQGGGSPSPPTPTKYSPGMRSACSTFRSTRPAPRSPSPSTPCSAGYRATASRPPDTLQHGRRPRQHHQPSGALHDRQRALQRQRGHDTVRTASLAPPQYTPRRVAFPTPANPPGATVRLGW